MTNHLNDFVVVFNTGLNEILLPYNPKIVEAIPFLLSAKCCKRNYAKSKYELTEESYYSPFSATILSAEEIVSAEIEKEEEEENV